VLAVDNAEKIRVGKMQQPAATVKQAFLSLEKEHILYVLDCLEINAKNIKTNAKGYITTALYNSLRTVEWYKPHGQSAFAFSDNPKTKGTYDIDKFFERRIKKPLKI
jgi:hypothetical protein